MSTPIQIGKSLSYGSAQSLTQTQKDQLALNWPEAVALSPLMELHDSADHVWLCGESGAGDFYAAKGTNLTDVNTVGASVVDSDWGLARPFVGNNEEKATMAGLGQGESGAFWFAVGIKYASISGASRPIMSEHDTLGSLVDTNWRLYRSGTNDLVLAVTRVGVSGEDALTVTGALSATNTPYNIVGGYDGTNLYLYVNGVKYERTVSFGMNVSDSDFSLGYANVSGTAVTNHPTASFGYCFLGLGTVPERFSRITTEATASDWIALRRALTGIENGYDSLSSGAFGIRSIAEYASITARGLPFKLHGISGRTSTPAAAAVLAYDTELLRCGTLIINTGNNAPPPSPMEENSAEATLVIDNVTTIMNTALNAGVRKIIIMGLVNRSATNSTAATQETLQHHQDTINTALAALAAATANVTYFDTRALFTAANYPVVRTAQAGGTSVITLDAAESDIDDLFSDLSLSITTIAGTGAGQTKTITAYNGTTKVLTVSGTWSVDPDNTTTYSIGHPSDATDQALGSGTGLFGSIGVGILPRSARDTTTSPSSTHWADIGHKLIGEAIGALIDV